MSSSNNTRATNVRYRGGDRRGWAAEGEALPVRNAAALLAVLGAIEVVIARAVTLSPVVLRPLQRLDFAAGVLMVAAGAATLCRWRCDGRAFAWWVGLGLVVLGLPGLADSSYGSQPFSLTVASSCVASGLFLAAIRSPEVDSALSTVRAMMALLAAITITLVTTACIDALGAEHVGGIAAAIVCWLLARARSRSTRHEYWLVLTLIGCGLGATVATLLPVRQAATPDAAFMHLTVAVIAALGAVVGLQSSVRAHRDLALEAQRQRDHSDACANEVEAQHAETLHEVRSTVLALEGGMRTLQPSSAIVDESQQALATALVAELARLRELVEPQHPADEADFHVRDALESLLTVSAAGGWPVRWNIPETLHAVGRAADVAQITHALLTNAHRYAPGSTIEVTAAIEDDYILLFVDDRGPGVPRGHRELIFERGERSEHSDGSDGRGLGLHIARRLARDLGGDLWVERRRPWGARFVLAIPAVHRDASDDQSTGFIGTRHDVA